MNGTMFTPRCKIRPHNVDRRPVFDVDLWYNGGSDTERPHRFDSEYCMYGCHLCEKMVSVFLQVPLLSLRAPTRSNAQIALARQVAMYLAHTKIGLMYSDVGVYFGRDRTTVAHACHMIEDHRDDRDFDQFLEDMEQVIGVAIPGYRHTTGTGERTLISARQNLSSKP